MSEKKTPELTERGEEQEVGIVTHHTEGIPASKVEETARERIADMKHLVDLATAELDNPGSYLEYLTQEAERFNNGESSVGEGALEKIVNNIEEMGEETSKAIKEIKYIVNPEQQTEK